MIDQPTSSASPAMRLYAEGRILAGFLTEEIALILPEFTRAPAPVQNAIRQKIGAALSRESDDNIPGATFRHVDEREVIELLAGVAGQCGGPTALTNLVGFEWVEIAGILAGHYVAAPMPIQGRFPTSTSSFLDIARYCIVGSQVIAQDLIGLENGLIVSPERLQLRLEGVNLGANRLSVEYGLSLHPSPVTILLVNDRAIAVRHQERLVALMEAGIKEALCLISYGYSTEILGILPKIDASCLEGNHPPRIVHFTDADTMVRIPVHTPRTLLTFMQQSINVALPQ